MNIQSSDACSARLSSGSAHSFRTQVRPWRRWKVSSLSTFASARFQGPKVLERCTSDSSTKPAWSYSALASTSSYHESSGTSNAYGYLNARRLALVDQLVDVDPEVAEQPVSDVGVGELVLDDRDGRAEVVERRARAGRPGGTRAR